MPVLAARYLDSLRHAFVLAFVCLLTSSCGAPAFNEAEVDEIHPEPVLQAKKANTKAAPAASPSPAPVAAKAVVQGPTNSQVVSQKASEFAGKASQLAEASEANVAIGSALHKAQIEFAKSGFGELAMVYAAKVNASLVVKFLLDRGCNIDARNQDGVTSLMAASARGHRELVSFLLEKGAAVNVLNNDGGTALTAAVYGGHTEIVGQLLGKKANVDVREKGVLTPLLLASNAGHTDIVKLLKLAGAQDPRVDDVQRRPASQIAPK
jgi:hypothetical protein